MSISFDLRQIVEGSDKQTNFTTMLLKLIFKADLSNLEKLRKGFPNAVQTIEHYKATGDILNLESD